MKCSRLDFTGEFKARVTLEALKECKTLDELAFQFDVDAQIISKWKQEFIAKSSNIFERLSLDDKSKSEEEQCYAQIFGY